MGGPRGPGEAEHGRPIPWTLQPLIESCDPSLVNDEAEILDLIADVCGLADEVRWAVGANMTGDRVKMINRLRAGGERPYPDGGGTADLR